MHAQSLCHHRPCTHEARDLVKMSTKNRKMGAYTSYLFAGDNNPMQPNRCTSLYFGYPCSVDAEVNPVEYAKMIIKRIDQMHREQRQQDAQRLSKDLCGLIPGSSMDNVIEMAEELRKSWRHATKADKTMMKDDLDLVDKFSDEMRFSKQGINHGLKVIEEFLNEHITDVKSFLSYIPAQQEDTVRLLCLCGHGLSQETAVELHHHPADDRTKRSEEWPWELCSCKDTMEQEVSVMTSNAKGGDIVVFSSGLLTPGWVIGRLRDC